MEVLYTLFRRLVLCWRLLSCLEVYLLPIWSVSFSIFCACFLSVQVFVIRLVECSILNSMLVSVRWCCSKRTLSCNLAAWMSQFVMLLSPSDKVPSFWQSVSLSIVVAILSRAILCLRVFKI